MVRRRLGRHLGPGRASVDAAGSVGRLDGLLGEALGPVPVPPSVWAKVRSRLPLEARRPGPAALDIPVPAFVAATAFCALFQTYRLYGVADRAWVQGVVNDFARLAVKWAGLAVTLISGGG